MNKPISNTVVFVILALLVIMSGITICLVANKNPGVSVVNPIVEAFDFNHSIGPKNPVFWASSETMFFSGNLHVGSTHEFTITTRDGQFVVASVPSEFILENGMPYFMATFQATAKSYYRVSSDVAIFSDIDTEAYLFLDPFNNASLP